MTARVGINGFGRMGRLVLRAGWDSPGLSFVHVNETKGGVEAAAHLLKFDSVHGRWPLDVREETKHICIDGDRLSFSDRGAPGDVPWDELGVDIVLECSGKFKTAEALAPYFARGVRKVIVAAPVKDGALNVVGGVNDDEYRPDRHHVLTAASCTTNCLAPIVKVIHEGIGIAHGVITTVHDMTNTQTIVDAPHKDLRRARAAALSHYMANACGRLAGTVLSGLLYQNFGLPGCLWACAGLVLASAGLARLLPSAGQARVSLAAIGGDE